MPPRNEWHFCNLLIRDLDLFNALRFQGVLYFSIDLNNSVWLSDMDNWYRQNISQHCKYAMSISPIRDYYYWKRGRIQVYTLIKWRREIERHFVNLLVQGLLWRKDCTVWLVSFMDWIMRFYSIVRILA